MAMERDDVLRVAELARLELEDADVDRMARELSAVLDFVAAIQRLDLAHSKPSVFAPTNAAPREDALDDRRLTPEQATAAAPEAEDGYFLVPPIVENVQP